MIRCESTRAVDRKVDQRTRRSTNQGSDQPSQLVSRNWMLFSLMCCRDESKPPSERVWSLWRQVALVLWEVEQQGKYLEVQGRYEPGLAPRRESAGQDAMERALIVPATYRAAVLGWRSVAALGSCALSGACGVCALCTAELSVGLSDVSAGIAKSADAVGRSGVSGTWQQHYGECCEYP